MKPSGRRTSEQEKGIAIWEEEGDELRIGHYDQRCQVRCLTIGTPRLKSADDTTATAGKGAWALT